MSAAVPVKLFFKYCNLIAGGNDASLRMNDENIPLNDNHLDRVPSNLGISKRGSWAHLIVADEELSDLTVGDDLAECLSASFSTNDEMTMTASR